MAETYSYTQTQWNTGDPITQEKMNKIENGIASAHSAASTNSSDIGAVQDTVSTLNTYVQNNTSAIQSLQVDVSTIGQNSEQGAKAWTQVREAIQMTGDVVTKSLNTRIGDTETSISNLRTEIQDAHRGNVVNDTLDKRFDDIDSRISEYNTAINIINEKFATAKNSNAYAIDYGSVDDRLEADEERIKTVQGILDDARQSTAFNRKKESDILDRSYGTLDARLEDGESRIVTIQTELSNAHESTVLGKTGNEAYSSIDERFEAIEGELVGQTAMSTRLDTIESDINGLSTGKVNKADIATDLVTDDNTKVLSAKQGKILKDALDAMDTAYKAADTALDERLDAIDDGSALDTTNGTLAARVGALETEIDMTSANSRIDTALSRIEAMDNSSTGSIAGLDTRIGALETTVNTTDTGLSDRMTTAESAISHAATSGDPGGLTERITAIETNISGQDGIIDRLDAIDNTSTGAIKNLQDADTELDARLDAIDGGTALTGTNLATRVTTLEGKDTIIIDYDGEHSNYTNDEPNLSSPSENADYLIADDEGKYFYWRYINNNWELISGAGGGSGSSSGIILAELPATSAGDPNIDYFIGTNALGYTHYRFIAGENGAAGQYIRILPNNLIGDISVDQYGGLVAHTIGDDQTNLLADFYALKGVTYTPNYDPQDPNTLVSQTLQFTGTNGETIDPIVIVGGGGGGGTVYSVNIESPTPASRSIPTNNTDPVTIQAKVVMKQGNELLGSGATASGQIQYRQYGASTWQNGDQIEVDSVDPALRYVIQNNTYFTVDITKYLAADKTMQIRLAIVATPGGEGTEVTRYQTFNVSKVNISIAAEPFDYARVMDSNFQFNYRCFGSGISKTVHFLLDGTDVVTPVSTTSHNTVLQQIIPMTGKTNGMHTFQVYFVTSTGLESNRLNYFILYNTDTTRQAPLIGAAAERTSIVDGDEIVVNYSVNTIGTEKTDRIEIELYTLDTNNVKQVRSTTILTEITNNILASPPYRTFNYPNLKKANQSDPDPDPITVYVKLTAFHTVTINEEEVELSDSQTVAIQVCYLNTDYELSAETNNLLFDYSAYGRSNNDVGKETYTYTYNKVNGQSINFTGTFNDFNWATDGYVDGESLTIGGGATLDINVPIFNSQYNNMSIEENEGIEKITTNGRTIEIDYEVLATTNLGATIIDCMTTGVNPKGFRVTPQNCYLLNSGSNIDIDETGFIKNEENVAAAYLNPGTRTHLTFVIEPISSTLAADNTYHQSVNIYINGEFANACPYNTVGNDFDNNATIRIGSDTCLIKLYSIKLYNRGLTEAKVLHNYAVAPVATRDKLTRLEDNDILNTLGQVDYEKARKKYNCLLLTGMGTVNGNVVPTMAPYKGYPSVVGRQKDGETVGKTESGLLLTKPTTENSNGYSVEFDLQDKLIDPNNLYGYASSNNVQGTSSQKFPVKNLKVYLAKGDDETAMVFDESETISVKKVYKYSINTAAAAAYTSVYGSEASLPTYIEECGANIATTVKNLANVPTQEEVVTIITDYLTAEDAAVGAAYVSPGNELIIHPTIAYKKSKKVKYALRENGIGESTLCWKADYMSTDHANTFNANIANTLYNIEDRLSDRWTDQTQFAVYGIKCLLFQQSGDGQPEFVGDGCLNNDKGNHKTFGLECDGDEDDDTMCQKWDFRNNTGSLLYFKHDGLFETIDGKPAVARELECIYPDEGDLADINKVPNYNHFQILSSWLGNRANYWYESDANKRAAKKQIFIDEFTNHFNFNHILIYYLFMEYTALCDNRVKNIHMRTDNAGEERIRIKNTDNYYFEGNSNPNSGPWTIAGNLETRVMQEPIMDENGDYQFDQNGNMELGNVSHTFVKDSVLDTIDWQQGEGHSNFAIWAPVLYDLDSCFSADNVGYLKIRYDADWDYSLYNKLKFAGFDSILWLQVEDCFQDDLKVMAKRLYNRVVGLNYSTFYRQQITDNLASLCPAITNQDMILKYEKPWTNGFLDYSQDVLNPPTSTDKYKYLQRGTRTGQKAIFMKQRSLFLASKYDGNEFIQDKITFRAGTQVNHENSVLTLVANQKLYPGAQFGDVNDTTKVTRRASKIYDATQEEWVDINAEGWVPEFTPCQIQHSGNMNNTDGIEIYGASVLNDIGDISRFHPWQVKVGNAVNLKKLILGSTAAGYSNTSTDDIDGLNSCVLLEEINVCNLKNLTSLQLSNNGFIKKVYATGSGLNTLALPRGGVLDTIAYGANTTDITIINQSRLTNFSYENSENNNYANVTRLWIENCNKPVYEDNELVGYTCAVPIKDIIMARLTSTTSADAGLRAGGLRIVGLNIDLGDDPTFLQMITSDLAKGTYLSAGGSHIEGNNQYPYISGTVKISVIRQSLLDTLAILYPNLIIDYGRREDEYTVTYKNYDGTVLFTDHGISTDSIKDPAFDTDPITNKVYLYSVFPETNGIPTKPEDAQYHYRFGTYDNQNKYRRFSGWVYEGTNVNPNSGSKITGTITFTATYPDESATIRQYTVRWFTDPNTNPILSYTEDYGTPIGSYDPPETHPEVNFIRAESKGNTVRVFKGWDKPVGKLTQNIDVYAQWETSLLNGDTSTVTMEQLTAADVYALAQLATNGGADNLIRNNDLIGQPIMIQMGQDYEYTNNITTNILGNTDKLVLEGIANNAEVYNNIKPLALNQDWTLAIDYKFLMNKNLLAQAGEFVLASCYYNNNNSIQGFKLSLIKSQDANATTHNIQISWGTATQVIDYITISSDANIDDRLYCKSYRNMVVLSHNSDSPTTLHVYHVRPITSNTSAPDGANMGDTVTDTILTWNNATLIETPLIFGGNYSGATTNIEETTNRYPAAGVIYWAKYWTADIGQNSCEKLASWPHETVPFYLSGFHNNSGAGEQIYKNSQLSFVAAQGLGERYQYVTNSTSTAIDSNNVAGWPGSQARTICNGLIYNAMPIAYQSIISKSTITTAVVSLNEPVTITTNNTDDYLFLPAEREVNKSESAISYVNQNETNPENTWAHPWHWMILANLNNVYRVSTGTTLVLQNITDDQYHNNYCYYRYRFSGHYIKPTARIFNTGNTDPTNPGTTNHTWTYNNTQIRVQSGDVWINGDGVAYMYFTAEEISEGQLVDEIAAYGTGGWKRADIWHTRTFHVGNQGQGGENYFIKVGYDGRMVTSPTRGLLTNQGRLLCPEFTI